MSSLSTSSENTQIKNKLKTPENTVARPVISSWSILTLLDAEAGGPLLQSDVVVAVGVALLEEASGAVLHGNERSTQGGQLGVGQVSVGKSELKHCLFC